MRIVDSIFPMIANRKITMVIKEKMKTDSNANGFLKKLDNPNNITEDILKELYKSGFEQKSVLEDKAKINIVGVTISISLILGANSVIKEIATRISSLFLIWIAIILMVLAVFYMIFAGLMSIKVITDENQVEIIDPSIMETEKKKCEYNRCINTNIFHNLIRNNYVYSSYECIRNSLVCLFGVFLMIVFSIVIPISSDKNWDSKYRFFYEKSTLGLINSNSDYSDEVEQAINKYINNLNSDISQKETAIIDNQNNFFIKFEIVGDIIHVIDIEKYEKTE